MAGKLFNLLTGQSESPESDPIEQVSDPVKYSEELLEDYYTERTDWAQIAVKNIEYRYNNQIGEDIRNKLEQLNQSPASWNLIHPNVELAKQFLTNKDPKFQASAREDSDVQMARAVTMVMSYMWDNSDGNIEFMQDVDEYYVGGIGCLFAYVDPDGDAGRGEVKFKSIDPFKVYFDPNSEDPFGRDSAHILIADIMTPEQVLENYSALDENILKKAQKATDDDRKPTLDKYHPENPKIGRQRNESNNDYYEVIDRYSKVKVTRNHVKELTTGREYAFDEDDFQDYKQRPAYIVRTADDVKYTVKESAIDELDIEVERIGDTVWHYILDPQNQPIPIPGEPTENAIPNSRIEVERVEIGDILDEIAEISQEELIRIKRTLSVGRVKLVEEVMEIDTYPIVPVFANHSRNPYPLSDVYFVRPLQDQYNKIKSDIIAHLANSKSTRVFVQRGSNRREIEENLTKAGAAIIEVDMDIGAPVFATPPQLASDMYLEPERIEKKVRDQFGIYGLSAGDPSDAPRTFNATLMIDENAKRRMGPKLKMLYGQLNVLAGVMFQYAQQVYDRDKIERIIQPNFEQEKINIGVDAYFEFKQEVLDRFEDFTTKRFDIKVVSGSTLPNNRWARMEYYIKLYQMGLIDDVTVLRNSGIAEIEQVLERKSQLAQAKQMIEQQQEQIKNLKGDMQTLQRETRNAKEQKELEKTKAKLATLEAKAEQDLKGFEKDLDMKLEKSLQERGQGNGEAGSGSLSPFNN